MKVRVEVHDNGNTALSVIYPDGTRIDVPLGGTMRDGTPRIRRLADKLQRAADRAADGRAYRYAMNLR